MGKGGGCGCSKFLPELVDDEEKESVGEEPEPTSSPPQLQSQPPAPLVDEGPTTLESVAILASTVAETEEDEIVETQSTAAKVYIVFYSMYGHTLQLAKKIKEGVDSVDGAEALLFQVPETLSGSLLEKMLAPPKPEDIPVIDVQSLPEADAIIFGFPTRFGMMCAQMQQFFDATGSLWKTQALAGKPAGFFFSTGTQGGGQETTALTAICNIAHHGMLYVPVGYTFQGLFNSEVHGGSPYGSGTYAGDGTRNPLDIELQMAEHQGRIIALVATKLKKG